MFNQLTYRNKNRLLGGGIVVFCILIYQLSISEAIEQKRAYENALQQAQQMANAPQEIASLQKELALLDQSLGSINGDTADIPQLILERVSSYCKKKGTELKLFPGVTTIQEQNYNVETTKFVVEGNFIDLLHLVYAFEQHYNLGKVVAVEFNLETELRTRRDHLEATLFIQNIKKA